jgi:DNA repair exonuclease SbcCD nuclease subunit
MNKPIIAICGDIHFGQRNFNKDVFAQQMMFFEEQFFPYLLENNIKFVVQVGDLFHDRNKIDWYIYNQINQRFLQWFDDNEVKLHLILGNHDLYTKSSLDHNSLSESTKSFKNVIVHDTVDKLVYQKYTLGFVPWIVDYKKYNLPDKCDICFGHFDLVGFPMMKGISSKEGLDYTVFKKYKQVYSGHYHCKSETDNVMMVGTPYQLTFNDYNEEKGFYVLDDNFNYQYIDNTINPRFIKMYYEDGIITVVGLDIDDEISKEDAIALVKNNYCRLYIKKADDQLALENFHASLIMNSCANYKIDMVNLVDVIEDYDSEIFDEKFDEEDTTVQLILGCVEGMTFDVNLDKNLLKELIKIEYKDAYDMGISIGDE